MYIYIYIYIYISYVFRLILLKNIKPSTPTFARLYVNNGQGHKTKQAATFVTPRISIYKHDICQGNHQE